MTAQNTKVATFPAKQNIFAKFAQRFSIDEGELTKTLKSTAFKQRDNTPVTDEQMMALLIVADQYGLNPFTKEIYAYPDKQNGIVPVVSIDGWNRIVQEHPQYDGMKFVYAPEIIEAGDKRFPGLKWKAFEWIEAVFYRKDHSHPTEVREYFEEVYRPPFKKNDYAVDGPWQSHDKRMHRHKAFIQGARMAFGFANIYDDDEAQRIIEKDVTPESPEEQRAEVVYLPNEDFAAIKAKYKSTVSDGRKTVEDLIAWIEAKGKSMTEAQKMEVSTWAKKPEVIEGESKVLDDPFVADMTKAEQGEQQ